MEEMMYSLFNIVRKYILPIGSFTLVTLGIVTLIGEITNPRQSHRDMPRSIRKHLNQGPSRILVGLCTIFIGGIIALSPLITQKVIEKVNTENERLTMSEESVYQDIKSNKQDVVISTNEGIMKLINKDDKIYLEEMNQDRTTKETELEEENFQILMTNLSAREIKNEDELEKIINKHYKVEPNTNNFWRTAWFTHWIISSLNR